jgi:hypothetical protein
MRDRTKWAEIQKAMVGDMNRFLKAMEPALQRLE